MFFKGLAFLTISDGSMSTQFTNEMDFRFSNHKFIAKVFLLLTLKQFFLFYEVFVLSISTCNAFPTMYAYKIKK